MVCKHTWKLLDCTILPSEAEVLREMGYTPNSHTSLKQTLVKEYSCVKCGKFKKIQVVTA